MPKIAASTEKNTYPDFWVIITSNGVIPHFKSEEQADSYAKKNIKGAYKIERHADSRNK